MVLNSNFLK